MDITYSIPIRSAKSGESSIYRHPTAESQLHSAPEGMENLKDLVLHCKTRFPNNNFIGTKQSNEEYTWQTYRECIDTAQAFGGALLEKNLVPTIKEYQNLELRFLGVYSKNRGEYLITDLAAMLYGITTVPIYDTLGPEALDFILDQTKMTIMVITKENIQKMINHGNFGYVKKLVCFDDITDEKILSELQNRKIVLMSFKELVFYGRNIQIPFVNSSKNSLYVISYTSGTTGNPKGAMMTHGNFLSVICAILYALDFRPDDVYLSYLPLAHVFERLMVMGLMYSGCAIGYFNGDPLKLKDDFVACKPTIIATVPRVLNRFFDVFKANIAALTGCKGWLVNKAVNSKMGGLKDSNTVTSCCYDKLVFKKMKAALGGRLRWMVIGSAPTSKEVLDFMKIALCIPIQEGYGQTESTGASFVMRSFDHNGSGCVGGPTVNTEFKIEDIPEMNYSSKDVDENNDPAPRGEMCIRGPGVFPGYYKDDEKTREAIDGDGWLHTGDVVLLQKNGSIKIIDRKKNIFKLAQGEYIAPEKLESVFKTSHSVSEIFVWGDSYQAYLVAIIVPKMDVVKKWAAEKGIHGSDEDILRNKEVRVMILEELKMEGKAKKFASFELIKNCYLEKSSFATKDLLTTTFKLKRNEAKKAYEKNIGELYMEGPLIK